MDRKQGHSLALLTNREGGCNTGDVYAEGVYARLTGPKP